MRHAQTPAFPDLTALGRIATTVLTETMPFGSLPCGLTTEDLVHEGWLAWTMHTGRPVRVRYARARFAMLDVIREAMSPVSGPLNRLHGAIACPETEATALPVWPSRLASSHDEPVRRLHLHRADIGAFRAACHRRLSARSAALLVALCIEGATLEEVAARFGITRQQAAVARSQAITRLTRQET